MHMCECGRYCPGKKTRYAGVKALDDTTLEVTLTQPNGGFLAMLAHPSLVPVDKVLIGRFGDKWTRPVCHQRAVQAVAVGGQ
jgi:oligopeptide transport system substrate-binding protein